MSGWILLALLLLVLAPDTFGLSGSTAQTDASGPVPDAGIQLDPSLMVASVDNPEQGFFGGTLDAGQIAQYAANAGFSGNDLVTAVAVALAESGGNPQAVGDTKLAPTNGPSIGLWQINTGSKAHPEAASSDLTDPQNNANWAFSIYQAAGSSFRPWSTFDPRDGTTPKYLAYLPTAQEAVSA